MKIHQMDDLHIKFDQLKTKEDEELRANEISKEITLRYQQQIGSFSGILSTANCVGVKSICRGH